MTGFNTSLFGFSKKSVLNFTKELSDTYAENLKEKDKEITSLKAEIKEITELKDKQIASFTKEINELKQKLKETEDGTDE